MASTYLMTLSAAPWVEEPIDSHRLQAQLAAHNAPLPTCRSDCSPVCLLVCLCKSVATVVSHGEPSTDAAASGLGAYLHQNSVGHTEYNRTRYTEPYQMCLLRYARRNCGKRTPRSCWP